MPLLAVFAVSLVSLVGIAAFSLREAWLRSMIPVLVGLAVGALLGDAFIHLIPESLEYIGDELAFGVTVLAGIGTFFVLEKYLRWHHAHHAHEIEHEGHTCENHAPRHLAPLVLVSDAVHNLVDGAVIAGAFLVSPSLGIATTVAVFLHEIPQEIADYGLLLHAGMGRGRALFYNFLSGLTALVGALFVLAAGSEFPQLGGYAAAFTAGAFIYIAAADLVPELQRARGGKAALAQSAAILFGVLSMVLLALSE